MPSYIYSSNCKFQIPSRNNEIDEIDNLFLSTILEKETICKRQWIMQKWLKKQYKWILELF